MPPTRRIDLTASERVHHIIEWLRSGETLTTTLAAKKFYVSRRTIARDLAHIREDLEFDIAYDPAEGSYRMAEEHAALSFVPLPSLAPVIFQAYLPDHPPAEVPQHASVHLRFSTRAVQAYVARGGLRPDALNGDGSLDVHFHPPNLDEFASYVLSRGGDVEVRSPPDFRRRVRVEIQRMLDLYGEGDGSDA